MEALVMHLGKDDLPRFIGLAHKFFLAKDFDSINEVTRQALDKGGDVIFWRDLRRASSERAGWIAVPYRKPKFLHRDLGSYKYASWWDSAKSLIEAGAEANYMGVSKIFIANIAKLLDTVDRYDLLQISIVFKSVSRSSVSCTFTFHEETFVH
jgi:hypothetical protein